MRPMIFFTVETAWWELVSSGRVLVGWAGGTARGYIVLLLPEGDGSLAEITTRRTLLMLHRRSATLPAPDTVRPVLILST